MQKATDSERLARVIEWLEPAASLPKPKGCPTCGGLEARQSPLRLWETFTDEIGCWTHARPSYRALLVATHAHGIDFAVNHRSVVLRDNHQAFGAYASATFECSRVEDLYWALVRALDDYRESEEGQSDASE